MSAGAAFAMHARTTFDSARVLLVAEPSATGCGAVVQSLQNVGHEVALVPAGAPFGQALNAGQHDLVILDLGQRGMPGLEALKEVRLRGELPVIVLSGRGDIEERLAAFDLGCDDYVQTPIEGEELSRRMRAVLRRCGTNPSQRILGPAGVTMRVPEHAVCVGDTSVILTPKEFALLRILLESRAQVISPDELSTRIWGYETFGSRNFVEAHISRLRAKLAEAGAPDVVATVRGVGYVVR